MKAKDNKDALLSKVREKPFKPCYLAGKLVDDARIKGTRREKGDWPALYRSRNDVRLPWCT